MRELSLPFEAGSPCHDPRARLTGIHDCKLLFFSFPFLDPSLVQSRLLVPENVGTVTICANGGRDSVPIIMEILNTSTASAETGSQDFDVLNSGEQILDPGEISCFSIAIIDDSLNEHVEYIDLLVTQGNDTNATFILDGRITILDDDFSEKLYSNSSLCMACPR